MSKEVSYDVNIKRSKEGNFIDGHYWWTVDVTVDGSPAWDYREYGWARSIQHAKKKALKSIYKSDKHIVDGTIGVVFTAKGTVSKIEDILN